MTALLGDLTAIDGVHIERPGFVTVTELGNTVPGSDLEQAVRPARDADDELGPSSATTAERTSWCRCTSAAST